MYPAKRYNIDILKSELHINDITVNWNYVLPSLQSGLVSSWVPFLPSIAFLSFFCSFFIPLSFVSLFPFLSF